MASADSDGSRHLILVKHAPPAIDPAQPAADWPLSEEGRRRCGPLAERLVAWSPARLVASREPKATETAALVAARLGLPWEAADDLHEHDRRRVGYLGEADWRAAIAALFARPDELVLGDETAAAALARFERAVAAALARHPVGTLVIVAHGTVIALYAARHAGLDGHALWGRLGLPSFVVLGLPGGRVEAIVEAI